MTLLYLHLELAKWRLRIPPSTCQAARDVDPHHTFGALKATSTQTYRGFHNNPWV